MGESERAGFLLYLPNQLVTIELRAELHPVPHLNTAGVPAHTRLCWPDETATAAFAARLAGAPGLAKALITLDGDLGAGKTSLVRHLLRALGVQGTIRSPTYALVEVYELPAFTIWHCDFYRFNDPREWEEAGLRDAFAGPGLKLVEWPQMAAPLLPVADLGLRIEVLPDGSRSVTLQAASAAGAALLQHVGGADPA